MARYIQVKNRLTGAELVIDTYEARYRRLAMGFLNLLRLNRYFLKHIILTQKEESYHPRILNDFMNQMRRRYPGMVGFWTIEVQEERLEKYGEAVLHWHIVLGIPWDTSKQFGSEDKDAIVGYWKYGGCEIVPYHGNSLAYLMKYVTKALGSSVEAAYQIRRIGSSRIGGWLRQSWKKLQGAMAYLEPLGSHPSEFSWNYRGAYALAFEEGVPGRTKVDIYLHPKTSWYKFWSKDEEPF